MNIYNTDLSKIPYSYVIAKDSSIKKVNIFNRYSHKNLCNNAELFKKLRESTSGKTNSLSDDNLTVLKENLKTLADKGALTTTQVTVLKSLIDANLKK